MSDEKLYTDDAANSSSLTNLENGTAGNTEQESEYDMSAYKIRRRFVLQGVPIWITANSEQEYGEKLMQLSAVNTVQTSQSEEKHPFRDYAMRWFNVFSKPNVEIVTAKTYERQLRMYILPVIGDMMLEDIETSDVQKIFNSMPALMKQGSKVKVKIVLNQIFNMAVEDGYMRRNPLQTSSLRIKGTTATVTQPYTVEQMRHLAGSIDKITNPYDKIWLALHLSLPLRPEEVLGLKWENVNLETCTLNVQNTVTHPGRSMPLFKPYTKTASSVRTLAFPEEIRKYFPPKGEPDEFVVGGASPLSYTQVKRMRNRIQKQTNFDDAIVPRRFRTTVATDISAQTHDLKLVQKMLGHSTPQMTLKHYDKGRGQATDASSAIEKVYGFVSGA